MSNGQVHKRHINQLYTQGASDPSLEDNDEPKRSSEDYDAGVSSRPAGRSATAAAGLTGPPAERLQSATDGTGPTTSTSQPSAVRREGDAGHVSPERPVVGAAPQSAASGLVSPRYSQSEFSRGSLAGESSPECPSASVNVPGQISVGDAVTRPTGSDLNQEPVARSVVTDPMIHVDMPMLAAGACESLSTLPS